MQETTPLCHPVGRPAGPSHERDPEKSANKVRRHMDPRRLSVRKHAAGMTVLCALLFLLTGCVSREDMDARLARGCAAAAELFVEEGYQIKKVNSRTFGDSNELGEGFREVRLTALESDGWYETEKEYRCLFAEDIGPFGMSYTASIYQLKVNGQTYGKEGHKILGSFADHLKLTEAVDKAMNQ